MERERGKNHDGGAKIELPTAVPDGRGAAWYTKA
jgi:hypothetical protein